MSYRLSWSRISESTHNRNNKSSIGKKDKCKIADMDLIICWIYNTNWTRQRNSDVSGANYGQNAWCISDKWNHIKYYYFQRTTIRNSNLCLNCEYQRYVLCHYNLRWRNNLIANRLSSNIDEFSWYIAARIDQIHCIWWIVAFYYERCFYCVRLNRIAELC